MKYKILILILFLSVIIALLLFTMFVFQKNIANCYITEAGVTNNCGLYRTSNDGDYSLYLARISGFYNKNSFLYVKLNFGMLDIPFPVGKIGRDQFNILANNELKIRDSQGQAYLNMVDIQSDTYNSLNEKYRGKITSILLLSDTGVVMRADRLRNNLNKSGSQVILSDNEKEFVKDWLSHWDYCKGDINQPTNKLANISILNSLKESFFDVISSRYLRCRQFITSFTYYE